MTERFTLLDELGRGGMGVVWKARDEETGQVVALKLLREAYAEDPEYLARFERELELARRIDSVHVVKVLGFGVRDKVPYLTLEYVDGPSLHAALVQHGPYSWPDTRALLIQLTQGLADANAAGVIHRDVKPSNVLIGPDGVAKLTDFGIARGLDLTRMTATSTLLGTPAYMAPEGPKDARSDLYSLGIIGYELLTGAVPFKGTSYQEVVVDHIRTPPDLSRLPPEARDVVGWLLEKDPAARPQRASELLPVLYGATTAPKVAEVPAAVALVATSQAASHRTNWSSSAPVGQFVNGSPGPYSNAVSHWSAPAYTPPTSPAQPWPTPPPGQVRPSFPPVPVGWQTAPSLGYQATDGRTSASYAPHPRFAGFWIRGAAFAIDIVIITVLSLTIIGPVIYMPLMWWKQGATLGQRFLGLRVVRKEDGGPISGGTSCLRFVLMLVEVIGCEALIGFLAFIWAAFDERKQAWHDKATGTVVIHVHQP
jgi:serine/threonine-protein kinase